jgi:hypothetical protein
MKESLKAQSSQETPAEEGRQGNAGRENTGRENTGREHRQRKHRQRTPAENTGREHRQRTPAENTGEAQVLISVCRRQIPAPQNVMTAQ